MLNTEYYIPHVAKRTLLVGVQAPYNRTDHIETYYKEFLKLAETNGITPTATHFLKLRTLDSGYFFSKGKLEEIKAECLKHDIEEVYISEPLTPQQERNLEDMLNCRIIDRTLLILEIFEKSAHSAEGKKQVAIAMFQHKKTRLAGKGIEMEQQMGIKGTRGGPGETAKEKARRILDDYIRKLKAEFLELQKNRDTQRKKRLSSKIPLVCLVGYTNAGKSTILNTLTKSSVLAEDKLFATLDTTVRELYIDGKKRGLVADTVGFIQMLPHRLIEAFKSTLSELEYADLLLHVVDISDPSWKEQIVVVHEILKDLDLEKNTLYVFNKADLVKNLDPANYAAYQPHVIVSGNTKDGVTPLINYLRDWSASNNPE